MKIINVLGLKDPEKMSRTLLLTAGEGLRNKISPWQTIQQLNLHVKFVLACAMVWEYGDIPHFKALHFDNTDANLMENSINWGVCFVIPVGVEEHVRLSRLRSDGSIGIKHLFFDPLNNPKGPLKTIVCENPDIYETLDDKWKCDQFFHDCQRFHYGSPQKNMHGSQISTHNMVIPVTVQLIFRDVQVICKM